MNDAINRDFYLEKGGKVGPYIQFTKSFIYPKVYA